MDDSTKILAVSYGNFSCRLEGFDDSVETMKAVVSYFHELAGHDRFMDMDPQAPDMETLAQLTEEQVGAPVEVEADGNTVSLRMADAMSDDVLDDEIADDMELAEEEFVEETENVFADDHDTIVLKAEETTDQVEEVDEVATDDADVDMPDSDDDAETDPANESVASKLQRIRAVVGKDDDTDASVDSDAEDSYAEDLPEPDFTKVAGVNPLAQRLADLAKRNAERAAEEANAALEFDDEDDENVSEEELEALEAEFEEEDSSDAVAQSEGTDDLSDDEDESTQDEVLQLSPEDLAQQAADDDTDGGPLVLTPDNEIGSRAQGDYGDFNLKEEVAEAQREIDEINEEKETRSKHDTVLDNVDKSMTRIMSQTDERLNEPEGRRHRDAFAQLKAAVAATEAARQLGDAGAAMRDKNEVFREDLGALDAQEASGRPTSRDADDWDSQSSDTTQDEPTEEAADTTDAPAPLKLVSSQIVDPEPSTLDAASARLRKIAAQKDAGGAPKGGFAEFAAQQGATELADLLEAAAAYIAFVEGDDDFSRPQVMKKVQAASANEFTREDGLRSFGRLLRQSRIIKLNNGRFQVAEDTRFRPGDKAAQG